MNYNDYKDPFLHSSHFQCRVQSRVSGSGLCWVVGWQLFLLWPNVGHPKACV